jgi:hypothetical protein
MAGASPWPGTAAEKLGAAQDHPNRDARRAHPWLPSLRRAHRKVVAATPGYSQHFIPEGSGFDAYIEVAAATAASGSVILRVILPPMYLDVRGCLCGDYSG